MKMIFQIPLRHALAVLTAGLAASGMFATTARADMYRWPASIPVENETTNGTRGIPGAAIMNAPVVTPTNVTVSWYGMEGWSTVEASTNLTDWFSVAGVAATAHAWSSTLSNAFGPSASFRVAQTNFYAGSGDCSGCHGDVYSTYATTAHSRALATLQAIGMGNNANCLQCHSVGMNQPTGFTSSSITPHLANVGCESCHGPAGWHKNSDHDLIRPAVSIDPAICGSCHQDTHHPTYEEYEESLHAQVNVDIKYGNAAATNYHSETAIIGTNVYYGFYVTPNGAGFKTNATTGIINSGYVPGSAVDPGQARAAQCGVCHSAVTRYAMLSAYNDAQAGNVHPIVFGAPTDAGAWSATCATCHDPHATNNIFQLRYPTRSTNFYTMPTTTDTYAGTRKSTNALGYVQTETLYRNTTFNSVYDPTVQVCAQCHNSRGATWDGRAYGLITNTVVTTATNSVRVSVLVDGQWTAYYTNVVTTTTNKPVGVGLTTPLIAYKVVVSPGVTNTLYTTNSSGYGRPPHHSPQYNILVGKPDTNFYLAATIHSHGSTGNANQCATCHVPIYDVNSSTKVTGHTYEVDFANCVQCHSGLSDEAYFEKIEDLQYQESNSIARVVSLLNQWSTNVAPGILRTNYGTLAWEYTTPGALGTPSIGSALVGPPAAFDSKKGSAPAGTNDNLQLVIPESIRKARFNLYMVLHDGSYGVHNPTFTKTMLTNAEALVVGELNSSASYSASFSVFPVTYAALITTYVGTNLTFTNLNGTVTGGDWNFGDGTVTNVAGTSVKYAYSTAGLYTVTFTDTNSGSTMTRQAYIKVREYPLLGFTSDVKGGLAPLTVTVTNTSTGTGSVDWWRWTFGSTRVETTDPAPTSYTFTIPGSYSVGLRANLSGGGNLSISTNNYVVVSGLAFTNRTATVGAAPLTVAFTNQSVGMSNYVWAFGDGGTSTASSPTYTYTNAGTYSVVLSGDYDGTTYTLTRTNFVVVNPGPVASFYANVTVGSVTNVFVVGTTTNRGFYVPFINTSSNATAYAWTFGDGKTATNKYASNIYTNAGTYTVTLKAIAAGVTNTLTRTNYIIVNP